MRSARRWATGLLAVVLAWSGAFAPLQGQRLAPRVALAEPQEMDNTLSDKLVPSEEEPADVEKPLDVEEIRPQEDAVPSPEEPEVPQASLVVVPETKGEPTGTLLLEPNGPEQEAQAFPLYGESPTVVAPECPFEWERHAFQGWKTNRSSTGACIVSGEDIPIDGDITLYAQWEKVMPEGVEDMDFSSCRLIVGMEEPPGVGNVLSEHDGVYLLQFADKSDTAWAYVDLVGRASMVAPDLTFEAADDVADLMATDGAAPTLLDTLASKDEAALPQFVPSGDGDVAGPAADLSAIGEAGHVDAGVIALVDTGVSGRDEHVVTRTSVIGDVVVDDNGHGTSMLDAMVEVDPNVRVASIKALDSWGTGSAASVYAAVESAIQMGAKVVNLSLSAPAVAGNAAVEQAIRDAHDAGVIVVGAAGNNGRDARWYVPGRMLDEAIVVGACDVNGERMANSNFGESVDAWVASRSTSYAAAKASAWLARHATFGKELEQLLSEEARLALGLRTDVESGPDTGAPPTEDDVQAAFTHPSMKVQAYWHNGYAGKWGSTYTSSMSGPANTGQEGRNYDLRVLKFTLTNGSESGGLKYRGYYNSSWNAYVTSGNVGVTTAKLVQAQFQFTGDLALHYVWGHSWHKYETDDSTGGDAENGNPVTCNSGGRAIDGVGVWFKKQKWLQTIMVRYQNADGSYGEYQKVKSDEKEYQDTYGWSRAADNTYNAASISYTVTKKETKYVSVDRRSSNNVIQARYQNADGSWGAYQDVVNAAFGIGETVSWTSPESEVYEAASCSFVATDTGHTEKVSVNRKKAVAAVRYRLQNVDGSYPEAYVDGGSASCFVGGSYTFTYDQTETHQAASATATIAPAATSTSAPDDVTVDLDIPRRTCTVQVNCYDPWGVETNDPEAVHAAYFDLSLDGGQTWLTDLYDEPSPAPTPHRGQVIGIRNIQVRPGFTLASVTGATLQPDGSYTTTVVSDATISITTRCQSFAVSFDPNGGILEGNATATQDFSSAVVAPHATRSGYGFAGWVPVKSDDAQWVEILYQSPMAAGFGTADGVLAKNELDAYATLGQLEQIANGGPWEFLLTVNGLDGSNQWRQASNPTADGGVEGFTSIALSWDATDFLGLTRRDEGSLMAWAPGTGSWWYAMGAYEPGKLPVVQERDVWTWQPVHLFVRSDDTLSNVTSAYASGYGEGSSIPVRAEDQLFKALWRAHVLTVSYDPNGGSFVTKPEDTKAAWDNESVVLPACPDAVREGYEPRPIWHVGAPNGPTVEADKPMSAQELARIAGLDLAAEDQEVTLYLDWRLTHYTIAFNPNCDPADVTGEVPNIEAQRGVEVMLPECGFSRELFDFVSWNTKPDGSGTWHAAKSSVTDLAAEGAAEVTLYAIWSPKQMKVVVPAALHYVARDDGRLEGPQDNVASVQNLSPEVSVEICGIRAESYAPWQLVREGEVSGSDDYAMGMSLGTRERLDFASLDGGEARFGCLGAADAVSLNDLHGEVGQAPADECEVGCLHWRLRAIRAHDVY